MKLSKKQQRVVQKVARRFLRTSGMTMGDALECIRHLFDSDTDANHAITNEITRQHSEGVMKRAEEIERVGLEINVIWNTCNDFPAAGCSTCATLNQTKRGEAWADPPPHPECTNEYGCRCTIAISIA